VIAVVQPHRYTRLRTCSTSSATASTTPTSVIVADVYPAGEAPLPGSTATPWSRACAATATAGCCRWSGRASWPAGPRRGRAGDLVVLLGAGDITSWAYALPDELTALAQAAE
jgi:UDP-N-acetylmuramate--alanine ligase